MGGERQADSRERSQQGQHRTPSSTSVNLEHKELMPVNRAFTLRNTEDKKVEDKVLSDLFPGNCSDDHRKVAPFFCPESNYFLSAVLSFLGFEKHDESTREVDEAILFMNIHQGLTGPFHSNLN